MTGNELANKVLVSQVAIESANLLMENLGLVIKALRAYDTPRTEARDKAFVAWMQKEVPITFASLWGQFDEAPRSPQQDKT